MKINLRRSIPLLGVTAAGAALAAGVTAGGAGSPVAARDQAPPMEHVTIALSATNAVTQHNTGTTAPKIKLVSAAARYTATVKVTDALLRSQPNTRSTKLDVSQPPRGVDIYCWHDYTDVSHYVWFKAHPWGSRYTGWMRADLLYRPGPLPPRC